VGDDASGDARGSERRGLASSSALPSATSTTSKARVYAAPSQAGPDNHRGSRRRQRGAVPAWLPSGQTRAKPLRDDPFRYGSASRPRSLAPMLRPQFGLAFVRPDGLARFGGLLQLGGSDLDRVGASSSGHSAWGPTALVPDCDADCRKRLPQPLAIGLSDLISHCRQLRGHTLRPPPTTSPASANKSRSSNTRQKSRASDPVANSASRLPNLPSPPCRHWVTLAQYGSGPMVAAFSGRPSVPDRTPRAAPRIDHQFSTGGELPPLPAT
jgi:hypothetical protein